MRKLVLGSLNIDKTYRVEHLVRPGETISARESCCYCGGKGFNQAVALARAGNEVVLAGMIGTDGDMLLDALKENQISIELIARVEGPSGHAIIQVDDAGQNSIIIDAGSNGEVTQRYIDSVLERFSSGDMLVLQNEIPHTGYAIQAAHERGMFVAFNPSPITPEIDACNLNLVNLLLINETEGEALTGEHDPERILTELRRRYPGLAVLLTLGKHGCTYESSEGRRYRAAAVATDVVDTTAAGDTFTGYFLSGIACGLPVEETLKLATQAAGICVSRPGALDSIPMAAEL